MRLFYPQCRVNLWMVPQGESDVLALEALVPLRATAELNAPDKADTYTVKLDASYFPMDPQAISTIIVGVYMGNTGGPGEDLDTRSSSNLMIIGHIDRMEYDRGKAATVTLEGSDYTKLFHEEEWGFLGAPKLELGRGLKAIVEEVVELMESTAALEVVDRFEEGAPTVPAGAGKKGRYFYPDAKSTPWDVLHEIAQIVGAVLTVEGDKVVIQPPRNIEPGDVDGYALFIEGRNLEELKTSRAFDTERPPNIRVKATDPATKETVEGTWPDPPTVRTEITRSSSGTKKEKKTVFHEMTFRHPAPTPELLEVVARRVYEGWAQQELEAEWKTQELQVDQIRPGQELEAAADGFKVTDLRNGYTVRLHVDRETRHVLEKSTTPEAKEMQLRRLNYRAQAAKALAEYWRDLDRIMFVESATHTYSADDGYSLRLSTVNALEV